MAHNYREIREEVEAAIQDLADRGYRSLGVARTLPSASSSNDGDSDESSDGNGGGVAGSSDKFEFLGVLALFDPPRHDTQRTLER